MQSITERPMYLVGAPISCPQLLTVYFWYLFLKLLMKLVSEETDFP